MKYLVGSIGMLIAVLVSPFARALTIEEILEYRSLSDVQLSPDGSRAIFVVTTANLESNVLDSNLWFLDVGTGEHFRLTAAPKRDWHPRWSPDGKRVAFLSDRDGGTEIWLMTPRRGEAEQVK